MLEHQFSMSSDFRRRDLITYAFLSQGIYGTDDRLAGLLPLFTLSSKPYKVRSSIPASSQIALMKHIHGP